jgi:hypothetical protein
MASSEKMSAGLTDGGRDSMKRFRHALAWLQTSCTCTDSAMYRNLAQRQPRRGCRAYLVAIFHMKKRADVVAKLCSFHCSPMGRSL